MLHANSMDDLLPMEKILEMSGLEFMQGVANDERRQRADELLASVGLEDKKNRRPSQLSGGQQQRVAVARALASKPQFVLADEPTANLDPETTDQVMAIFAKMNARGTAVIMATHDGALVNRYPRRTLRLVDGKIQEESLQMMRLASDQ